jgi:effector-binding domain-containing protein
MNSTEHRTMQSQFKQIPPIPVIARRDRLTIPQISAHSGPAIQSLIETLNRLGVSPAGGAMIYVYHGCNGDPAIEFDLEICLPVDAGLAARVKPPIELKSTSPFQCMAVDYVGPMSGIGRAWMELVQAVRAAGRQPTEQSREIYKKWVGFDSAENVTELQQGIV